MKLHLYASALMLCGLAMGAGPAVAATPAKTPAAQSACFFAQDWQGWRAADDKTLYLRVGVRDVYRVDLSAGSSLLTGIDPKLINVNHGSSSVCSPLDLDLMVYDGFQQEPIIAKSITKLTAQEIAALPKTVLP